LLLNSERCCCTQSIDEIDGASYKEGRWFSERAECWLTHKPLHKKEITMKRSMVTFLKGILSVLVALVFFVTVSGCQKEEGTMEKAGKKVDESVEKTKDAMEKAGEKVGESVDKAKQAMDDAAQKAKEKNNQ
jgi:hypothetical protein